MKDETCKGCGKNHGEEVLNSVEDLAYLRRSASVAEEEDPKLSAAASYFFRSTIGSLIPRTVQIAEQEGRSVSQILEQVLSEAGEVFFMMGVMCAHHFQDEIPVPTVFVTEEMVEEQRAEIQRILDMPRPDAEGMMQSFREFLASQGINPDEVQIVGVDDLPNLIKQEQPKQKEEREPGSGMYL